MREESKKNNKKITYCVVGSLIAFDKSSNVSADSSMAFSYKLMELSVCTTLRAQINERM